MTASISRGSVEYVTDAVRDLIMRGEYPLGTQLKENDLASRLEVSRTPIREALRRLQAEGIAEYRPNRGTFVPEWTIEDREEVFELRMRLETFAAELAAQRITPEQIADLRRMCRSMEDDTAARDSERFDRISIVNNRFHRLIASASGRPRLEAMLTSLLSVPLMHRAFSTYEEATLVRSNAHHCEIVDALEARDPEWAAAVVRTHVRVAQNLLQAIHDGGQQ